MAVNQERVAIEKRITEAVFAPASDAFDRGCTGIHIRFSQNGGALVECYYPKEMEDSASEETFADCLIDAARLIIKAKMMIPKTDLSDDDMAAHGNLVDQMEALRLWLFEGCVDEELDGEPGDASDCGPLK